MKIKTHKTSNELNYTKIKQSDKYRMWSIPEITCLVFSKTSVYNWFTLLYTWNLHNTVHQLYSNRNCFKKNYSSLGKQARELKENNKGNFKEHIAIWALILIKYFSNQTIKIRKSELERPLPVETCNIIYICLLLCLNFTLFSFT